MSKLSKNAFAIMAMCEKQRSLSASMLILVKAVTLSLGLLKGGSKNSDFNILKLKRNKRREKVTTIPMFEVPLF